MTSAGPTPASSEVLAGGGNSEQMYSCFCVLTAKGRKALASSWPSPMAKTFPPALIQRRTASAWAARVRPPPGPTTRTSSARGTAASIGRHDQPHLLEVFSAGIRAGVEHLAHGRRRVGGNVAQHVGGQPSGCRIVLRAARHVHLAEQHEALALAILHERTELEAVSAVHDRQEVPAGGFFDQHGGHVAPVAGPVGPRDLDAAPLDGRAEIGLHCVIGQPRRQDRRLAAPVAKVLAVEPGKQRMVGHAREDLLQAVLLHAEAEALLQHVGRLLEHDDLQPVADPARCRAPARRR